MVVVCIVVVVVVTHCYISEDVEKGKKKARREGWRRERKARKERAKGI